MPTASVLEDNPAAHVQPEEEEPPAIPGGADFNESPDPSGTHSQGSENTIHRPSTSRKGPHPPSHDQHPGRRSSTGISRNASPTPQPAASSQRKDALAAHIQMNSTINKIRTFGTSQDPRTSIKTAVKAQKATFDVSASSWFLQN